MTPIKYIAIQILVCLTSFFFFPFSFSFLPAVNTKMMLAVFSLVICGIRMAMGKNSNMDKSFVYISIWAILVSLAAYATTVINNTIDYTYADYIVSMWVWLGGAYTLVYLIRLVHGHASVMTIANYLIATCVLQCVLALVIDSSPTFSQFVSRIVDDLGFIEMDRLSGTGRLYGIGCCLDVAGTRFASVLIILACIVSKISTTQLGRYTWLYITAFAIIIVIGNMISRTTLVGAIIAVLVWVVSGVINKGEASSKILRQLAIITIFAVVISVVVYNLNSSFKTNIRFAFEGFFSLVEKGHWETNSNNILKQMVVFPETLHTWLIGDGYLINPFDTDLNYIGENYGGYYKRTDIGYLRFIFYFGLLGLCSFCFYFISVAHALMKKFIEYRWMFLLILVLNFIIWFKISTDIFLVFAIFLCIRQDENEEYEASIALPEEKE